MKRDLLLIELLKKSLTAASSNALPIAELNMGFCVLLKSFPLTLHPVQTASQNLYHKMCGFFASIELHAAGE